MTIDSGSVSNGSSVQVTANTSHAIGEQAFSGYHFVNITDGPSGSCPASLKSAGSLPASITLAPGVSISCSIHNAINTTP